MISTVGPSSIKPKNDWPSTRHVQSLSAPYEANIWTEQRKKAEGGRGHQGQQNAIDLCCGIITRFIDQIGRKFAKTLMQPEGRGHFCLSAQIGRASCRER